MVFKFYKMYILKQKLNSDYKFQKALDKNQV